MYTNSVQDVRREFRRLKDEGIYRNGTIEIQNAHFHANQSTIFGEANAAYQAAELEWYNSRSLNVHDLFRIYGKEVKIWADICDDYSQINSNYGWCIDSKENGSQYINVADKLWDDPDTRQAVMIYNRPSMHIDAMAHGMKDFMCTQSVQYFINNNELDCQVNMRSNDAIFGYLNDLDWQRYVLFELAKYLSHAHSHIKPGTITWNAGSLHIYERHWDLIV